MLLKSRDIKKTYPVPGKARKKVVQALGDLEIQQGARIGLMGVSGVGKTTLGLILAGLVRPDSGRVLFHEKPIHRLRGAQWKNMRKCIQMVFQHPESAFDPRWKMRKSLEEPYRIHGLPIEKGGLESVLEEMGLPKGVLDRYPSQLSGGELQRAALARALCLKPDLAVLDEPTSMLDPLTQSRILAVIQKSLKRRNTACLFITHNLHVAKAVCSQCYVLEEGRLENLF
ncbi:ABC transporter ATP-binding protein [Desulfatibacillum aliphaticivorans]|uniref:ABC transporter ATP-binding protein n=1 Tax=Desulfatibacillum aliphaticivorans TaxID=218208 RepID=UPI00040B83B6|nr:ATP-binding cassette domain-containing protein [Desulfatibacillum aliphaticivorans]